MCHLRQTSTFTLYNLANRFTTISQFSAKNKKLNFLKMNIIGFFYSNHINSIKIL